jgi:hypothetical protein
MERDSVLGHGISEFLRESMMERGDNYQMVVCNTTGALAIYNKSRDLFMSPMADGPLRFFRSETGSGYALDTMTRYGRKFSIVSVPYSLKLLIQELAAINIQLRIITEDNLPQIDSMAFSDNLKLLTLNPNMTPTKLVEEISTAMKNPKKPVNTPLSIREEPIVYKPHSPDELPPPPLKEYEPHSPDELPPPPLKKYEPHSPDELPPPPLKEYEPHSPSSPLQNVPESPVYNPNATPTDSPAYALDNTSYYSNGSPAYATDSPAYALDNTSYYPNGSPAYATDSPAYNPSYGGNVNDYNLGEQVYFTRSVDLGFPANHLWKVSKKGGRLLTLTTDRGTMVGGRTGSFTRHDFLQIASPNEVAKIDEYRAWDSQRAGALIQQQQQQYNLLEQSMHPQQMQNNGTPQINIKFVGGNDFSKGDETTANNQTEPMTGGKRGEFNDLVIPSVTKKTDSGDTKPKSEEKNNTILGGLAEFGKLVINKIS